VFKLWKVLDGHWLFTFALVEFLEQGNRLSIGRGNHDPEFLYDVVREHFRKMLFWFYSQKMNRGMSTAEELDAFRQACDRIQFLDWFYYEPGLIWVEHGSQYDELNSFPHWLAPYLPRRDHIEMPWGSFFVRYLFNSIENEQPWADNIKPPTDFLIWFVTRKPVLALRFVFGNGREMLRKMAAAWRRLPRHNPRPVEHAERLKALALEWGLDPGILADFDAHQEMSVLRAPHGIWKLWKWLTRGWRFSLLVLAYLVITVIVGAILIIGQILAPTIPGTIARALSSFIHSGRWIASIVSVLLLSRWFTFAYIVAAIAFFIRQMFPSKPKHDNLVANADYIQQKLKVPYITMGHTHDTHLVTFRSGAEYYNTGTWTTVFSPDERLIREESELVFLQCLRQDKGVTCKLMKWDDGPGEPRLVKLFNVVALPKKR
jgi:hypothetical protein